ncbi:MAG: hypothetical protein MJY87_01595 [Fibrobacter sp.]|nr:hypothetical protein [Fibrobacter sp.]
MKIDLKQIIPNENFTSEIREWLDAIKTEHGRLQRTLKKHVEGRIREATDRNGFSRFYLVSGEAPNGKYVCKENLDEIEAIAQRDYNKKVLAAIESNIKTLEAFLAKFCGSDIAEAYTKLKPGRKSMVQPIAVTDEDYATAWLSLPYKAKGFESGTAEIFSASGLRVRSKSEAIIADILADAGVPFRYEFPVNIRGAGTFHPDFYCINLRTRKEFIWEHFGMMSDCDYAEKAIGKISLYAKAGWTLGNNLLATFESTAQPLNSKAVKQTLLQFLGAQELP